MRPCLRSPARWTAALAWCVLAPLLALTGGSPALAANTAGELLVDPADRTATLARDGVRPFAGSDRYETAVRLAERYAHERGGLGAVSTVILVSGETPVDGAVAAGLSARESAPILLTPPDRLPRGVNRFIEAHAVSKVLVIGGDASVSGAVIDELTGLNDDITIRRIMGGDRYRTAAAIADELDGSTRWCDTDDTVALLASGDSAHLGFVVATGPLAYAMELPVLLAEQASIPRATVDALRRLRIDRVLMVGDETVLSDDLLSQLVAAGVDTTERIDASGPQAAGAAIAQLMTGVCGPDLGTARYLAGLVGRDSPIDGVAAAPLLGTGLDGSGPIPLLIVHRPLEATVSSFLRSTRSTVDERRTHTELIAIGGTSAISDTVMSLAIRSAITSRGLTARIDATEGSQDFRVTFSEGLIADGAKFIDRVRDLLYVNETPARIVDLELVSQSAGGGCETLSSLSVKLHQPLAAGDVIELVRTDEWFATNGDRRRLAGTAYEVPAPRVESPKLTMEIIAIVGHTDLIVAVEYDPESHPGSGEPEGFDVDDSRIRVLTADDAVVDVGAPAFVTAEPFFELAFYRLSLTSDGGDYPLRDGDLVDVRGGAVNGPDDTRSGRLRARLSTPTAAFGVSSVLVGQDNPGVDDSARTDTPDAIEGVSTRAALTWDDTVHIVGKWSGNADGAAGNAWEIDSARASARLAASASAISRTGHPAVRVWVDTSDRVVLLRFIDSEAGEPPELTHGDLVNALNGNSAFSRHFAAELVDGCDGGDELLSLADESPFLGTTAFSGGLSSISFLVGFTDHVSAFVSDSEPDVAQVNGGGPVVEIIDDVLGGLIPDYGEPSDLAPPTPDQVESTTALPYDKVLFRFTTADPDHAIGQVIDFRRSRIEIAPGIAAGFHRDDLATEDIDENLNPAKTVLAVSSRDRLLNGRGR